MEGVKEGCHGEVKSEILAGGDFSRCDTPPLTPGKFIFVISPSIATDPIVIKAVVLSCTGNKNGVDGGGVAAVNKASRTSRG